MRTLQECISAAALVLTFLIITAQALNGNLSGSHTYIVRYRYGDNLIPVTVVLDYKRQTEYVINLNSRSPAKSMTLYDFKEKVIAYKDLKNGECFVGRLSHETLQEEDAVLKRLKNPVESEPLVLTLEPDRPGLTPTAVRNLAGHKIAVFCRRMNTWTLMPDKTNKREKRDSHNTLVDRTSSSSSLEDSPNFPNHVPLGRKEVPNVEQDNADRRRSHRDFSGSGSNGSFSVTRSTADSSATVPLPPPPYASIHHQGLNDVYPFILPRQRYSAEKNEEGKEARQTFGVYNTTTADDSLLNFGFVNGRSSFPVLSESRQSRVPPRSSDGASLTASAKRAITSSSNTNHPVIIPSISFRARSSGEKLPSVFVSGGHPQTSNNFYASHSSEDPGGYPSLREIPPEAFVLPLTRSSASTSAPRFVFNHHHHLGYEIVHPDVPSASNGTDRLANISAGDYQNGLTVRPLETAIDSSSSASNANLGNRRISSNSPSVPFQADNDTWDESNQIGKTWSQPTERKRFSSGLYGRQVHLRPLDESPNDTGRSYNDTNTLPNDPFDKASSFASPDLSDSAIQIPRWYPEITKEISIPLEIEVLHHEEEFVHGVISNSTKQVHTTGDHEVEDHSSLPNVNTPIKVSSETYTNLSKFHSEVKDLSNTDFPKEASLHQIGGRQDEKVRRTPERKEFGKTSFPTSKSKSNDTVHEIFPQTKPPTAPLLTNDTEVVDVVHGVREVSFPRVQQNFVHQTSPPQMEVFGKFGPLPKRQNKVDEKSFAVHDFNIDEGVPSYRKRFPVVSQLFAPDETVSEVARLPDRNFRSPHTKKKPSTIRRKTHGGVTPRVYDSKSAWRRNSNNFGSSNLIGRPQMRFNDQGVTYHHRGPYDQQRKRLGILPPGVSVHPRHPQAPYADLATETGDKTMPVDPLLQSRPRKVHHRPHHRRHQRRRNRIAASPSELGPSVSNWDVTNCCSGRRSGRHLPRAGCCSQPRGSRRQKVDFPPSHEDKNEVSPRKKVEDLPEDRCMREKMCRTVYQSTKKVLVCRNIPVEGC